MAGAKLKAKPRPTKPEAGEVDPLTLSQQSSSDDGMAAVLVQKIQSGMEKKKKEKEARYFQTYQQDTQSTNARGAMEFTDHSAKINEIFDAFVLEYAKVDDEIRAIWSKIISAHAPFTGLVQEQLANETAQEKEREEQQVLGLAYIRKSEDGFARTISSLLETDLD